MNYYDRIQKSINFIEENIKEQITLNDVSQVSFGSLWHFHRIFRFMTGSSLKDYIRKRRLSKAGKEILLTKRKIIDIALDYGYETPESFTRAFRKAFGLNPLKYRNSRDEHPLFERFDVFNENHRINYSGDNIEQKIVAEKENACIWF